MIDAAIIPLLLAEGKPLRTFVCAVFGSLALEVINAYRIYEAGRAFPTRYRRWSFWFVRILVALVGGGLAFIMKANNDLIAFQVGMTAPALVIAMSRRAPGSDEG